MLFRSERLRALVPEWKELNWRQTVNDMEAFGQKTASLGTEYAERVLIEWGETVQGAAYQFDLERLNRVFARFPEFIDE